MPPESKQWDGRPVCGVVDAGNRQTQAEFHCLHCGHEAHADVNAAQNILARGVTDRQYGAKS
ncbi:transposase [Acidithiobacillus sp. 'AMD consortium']|uniref:transposase n=1 Tax=Acidithiobacillus sp. 'AMD consortium' TaxID=2614801 RepID=UPI001CEF6E2D|nr:transposase [Acidithiobacillus sp. 'AMD consortium']